MFDPATFLVFVAAALVLVITPGPAVLLIVGRSVALGRVAGVVTVAGVGLGNFAHVIAAVVGLSALLASSALAFSIIKIGGAAYLIVLGLRKLLSPTRTSDSSPTIPERPANLFRQAMLVAMLNPKTALFFLAFLPQFTQPERGSIALQLFVLGTVTVFLGIVTDTCYALLSGTFAQRVKRSETFLRNERYILGFTYCGLGIAALFTGSNKRA
jgi:threonine/homoserine/homoserine lactone efflux protein